ncbi:unnamed protein product [Gongylonema pulchrum]|uniref:Histone domain-containing protein n=1 Tax=Gongylonema pulchrum TaxID=637853 RepID=A0A183E3E3_9BILA|nr:unnamed protein product [Gongylonema pulchrum]
MEVNNNSWRKLKKLWQSKQKKRRRRAKPRAIDPAEVEKARKEMMDRINETVSFISELFQLLKIDFEFLFQIKEAQEYELIIETYGPGSGFEENDNRLKENDAKERDSKVESSWTEVVEDSSVEREIEVDWDFLELFKPVTFVCFYFRFLRKFPLMCFDLTLVISHFEWIGLMSGPRSTLGIVQMLSI